MTVSKGWPMTVTMIPPMVPAKTSLADLTSVACSWLGGSAAACAAKGIETPYPRECGVTRIPGASYTARKLRWGRGGARERRVSVASGDRFRRARLRH